MSLLLVDIANIQPGFVANQTFLAITDNNLGLSDNVRVWNDNFTGRY